MILAESSIGQDKQMRRSKPMFDNARHLQPERVFSACNDVMG